MTSVISNNPNFKYPRFTSSAFIDIGIGISGEDSIALLYFLSHCLLNDRS